MSEDLLEESKIKGVPLWELAVKEAKKQVCLLIILSSIGKSHKLNKVLLSVLKYEQ